MARVTLARSDTPRVSILIVAFRNPDLLRRTINALSVHVGCAAPTETVIWLNGATEGVTSFVRELDGVIVGASEVNLGFAGGTNRAAALSRGEYLVLLNDDAEVTAGWLEALIEAADSDSTVGAVGSLLTFPDGTIQEAGSILWADGSAHPIGRGLPGDSLRYRFRRAVDFCSASSLLVRRTTWERVGGLSDEYFPAYYEDADLAMAIRQQGERVMFEPRSIVRHHESSGTDPHFRLFLHLRNRRTFVEKWGTTLKEYNPGPPSTSEIDRAIRRAGGWHRRVLLIDDRLPQSGAGSGFSRTVDFVVDATESGYLVTFYGSVTTEGDRDALFSRGVEILDEDLDAHLARPERQYEFVVISRPHNLERFESIVRRHQPQAVLVYDAEALYFRRLETRAKVTNGHPNLTRAELESEKTKELNLIAKADYVACLSHEELKIIQSVADHPPVELIEPIVPAIEATSQSFEERRGMLFVSGWLAGAESPNADALIWFATEVMPLVRQKIPWAVLRVTGGNPPPNVTALASPFIEFTGQIPSLATIYGWARVAIAPIRYGAGVKLKVPEALQFGVPVVATTIGADGLNDNLQACVLIADGPDIFANNVISLLSSRSLWDEYRGRILELSKQASAQAGAWSRLLDAAYAARWRSVLSERAID